MEGSLANDTVSVTVAYDGSGVANATVYANGQTAGTTSLDGMVISGFDANGTYELELGVVKGAFEAELGYTVENGSLTPLKVTRDGDGEKPEEADETDEEKGDGDEEDEEADDDDYENDTDDDFGDDKTEQDSDD